MFCRASERKCDLLQITQSRCRRFFFPFLCASCFLFYCFSSSPLLCFAFGTQSEIKKRAKSEISIAEAEQKAREAENCFQKRCFIAKGVLYVARRREEGFCATEMHKAMFFQTAERNCKELKRHIHGILNETLEMQHASSLYKLLFPTLECVSLFHTHGLNILEVTDDIRFNRSHPKKQSNECSCLGR